MEPTLFSFIWKHSKRQQLWLLVLTCVSFPFLYASLELPKRIINDAIGSPTANINLFGYSLTQVEFLMLLCLAFLGTVLAGGLMKMHINTRKGVLSERMLRRLRYQLIARMMRFPLPYFRTTSQGEMVSMITSEAEPMGGLMGDAIAQPVFQFGQMMTIVTFLFMQSVWFGLASVALIPLQGWLIPRLQRQINLLNKDRIQEVRKLSAEIGETAAGISDLRTNGGWRFRLAQVSDRLGKLFEIRFRIYRKKFFMKFLNNFITQITPFLFYAIGGLLAIRGDITVGALVAALGAYKDLSSPWKELLAYYNQVQDMSLRWKIVTERFAPQGMIREDLFDSEPEDIPHLDDGIELRNVTVHDQDGAPVLEDLNLSIPHGARVAIQSAKPAERTAFAQLLVREVLPARGKVILSGHALNDLHQAVIAARIGYAHSKPYLFDGSLGDNLMMPLRVRPQIVVRDEHDRRRHEAERSGNSPDPVDAQWVDAKMAGIDSYEGIRDWWFKLVEALGIDEFMFRRTIRSMFDPDKHPELAAEIVRLRPEISRRLQQRGLDEVVHTFDPERFNPAVPLGGNLLFAAAASEVTQQQLVEQKGFLRALDKLGLTNDTLSISQGVIETLNTTFGRDGTDHPLFRRLGMDEEMYHQLTEISARRAEQGDARLSEHDRMLLLTVPFLLTAEQIGPSFPEEYKERILDIRRSQAESLRAHADGMFVPIDKNSYAARLTVIENAIFGRVSILAGARAELIEDVVAEVLNENGLRRRIAAIIYDLPAGLGGANLPTVFQERTAFNRAAIKRPDILVMDQVLASHDSQSRLLARQKLREVLPDSIMIFMEDHFAHPEAYDIYIEIRDGRIDGVTRAADRPELGNGGAADLSRKLAAIMEVELFSGLDPKNQRLLAFGAQWYEAAAGQVLFNAGEAADAAYLCVSGQAELRWPEADAEDPPISIVEPGRLIGDLSIIAREPRALDLIAIEDCVFLRVGAAEFRAVIESDAKVAVQLLETVAGHLNSTAEWIRASQISLSQVSDLKPERRPLDRMGDHVDS